LFFHIWITKGINNTSNLKKILFTTITINTSLYHPLYLKMQNPSIVLYGPHNAKIEERPIPELSNPHDVIIRINYVGVCGSDVGLPPMPIFPCKPVD